MKFKSLFLLLIFSCSLVPLKPVEAEEILQRSPEDAFALMYISDSILLNEIVDDETSSTSKVSASTKPDVSSDETTDLINQMINATKQQRNDHDRKCRETVEIYRQQGKNCEVDQTNAYCKSKRAELTAKIAALRKKRGGDERKWFTKQWHGIKRAGARFWHKVGPLGRKFLREVGPQALKIVQAGGPGTEALLKNLLKHTAKNMVRQRAKQIGIQALQRILRVQIDVAAAAGVDICDPEEEAKSSEVEDKEGPSQEQVLKFSLSSEDINFSWYDLFDPPEDENYYDCGSIYPDEDDSFEQATINIQIDPVSRTLTSEAIQGSRTIEHIGEWKSSLFNQSFVLNIDGPYEIEEEIENVALLLKGNANLSMTMDGSRKCNYWVYPESGDPVSNFITIDRNQTNEYKDIPYKLIVITEDGTSAEVTLWIGYEYEAWYTGYGFGFNTLSHTITKEEMDKIWPDD
jgi:hypothetical protein